MTLKEFIKKLEKIAKEHGDSMGVVMADYIPVVTPVFVEDNWHRGEKVVITDEE